MSGLMEWDPPDSLPTLPPVLSDTDLIAVCGALQVQQREWQRLWEAAGRPDNAERYGYPPDDPLYAEMEELRDYTRRVWPATDDWTYPDNGPRTDLAVQLIGLRARSPAELKAKATAVLALLDAAAMSECRGDEHEIVRSLVEDIVGDARIPVGDGP